MKDALDKLIKRLVLRKYPFIKDFEINADTFRPVMGRLKKIGVEKFIVIYYVTPDEDGGITVTEDFKEVAKLTETLFKMLGPEHYQRFDDVEFHSTDD
jgi:hypothetical protein